MAKRRFTISATLPAYAPPRNEWRRRVHAAVLEALLTNDEVNVTNEAATLRGAYNRPAPPHAITAWSYDGTNLRRGDVALAERSRTRDESGELVTYD